MRTKILIAMFAWGFLLGCQDDTAEETAGTCQLCGEDPPSLPATDRRDLGLEDTQVDAHVDEDVESEPEPEVEDLGKDPEPEEPDAPEVVCGDGIKEGDETCDPPESCPATCDDMRACTADSISGSAETCDLVCGHQVIEMCVDGDGCCPPTCDGRDLDCAVSCDQDVTWPPEWAALEEQLIRAVNGMRAEGVTCGDEVAPPAPELALEPRLRTAVRCHSLDMARNDYIGTVNSEGEEVTVWAFGGGYRGNWRAVYVTSRPHPDSIVGQLRESRVCAAIMFPQSTDIAVGYVNDRWGQGAVHSWTLLTGTPR